MLRDVTKTVWRELKHTHPPGSIQIVAKRRGLRLSLRTYPKHKTWIARVDHQADGTHWGNWQAADFADERAARAWCERAADSYPTRVAP